MAEPIEQDELDQARFLREKQEYLDARAAYDTILGQVSSTVPLPYGMQSNYGIATDGPNRAATDPWIRQQHPDLAAAGARVVKEEQDFLALDEPVSSHAQPNCSIAKYTGEKIYEYYAMAEMIYKLATDEKFRELIAEKIGQFLTQGAFGNYLTANDLLNKADPLYRKLPDFLDYLLADDAEDAVLEEREAALRARIAELEALATVYRDQSFQQMGEFFQSMWEKFTKRFSECGLLYGISTIAVDGAFLVAEIGAGIAFLKGVKIVSRALPSGKMVAELISANGVTLGKATWSKEALAAKYGKPDDIHIGGDTPDANRQIPDMPAEDVPRRGAGRDADPEPEVVPPRRVRSNEELAPGGKVPSNRNGGFADWWDGLSHKELENLLADSDLTDKIGNRIRNGGGEHEWLKVSQQLEHKRLGFSMREIQDWVTATKDAQGPLPKPTASGHTRWRHNPEAGGSGSGPGSKTMHNSLDALYGPPPVSSRNDLLKRMGYWANSYIDGGIDGLPAGLRNAIKTAGGG